MREIKFRACVEEPGTDIRWFYYFKIGETVSPSLSVVAWEQFTGLVDRKGREIYEGDIVRFRDDYSRFNGWVVSMDNPEHLMLKAPDGKDAIEWFQLTWHTNMEVIGNIHEIPQYNITLNQTLVCSCRLARR